MPQTKRQSFLETVTNVGTGYIIAIFSQMLIFPLFDIKTNFGDNLLIALWFTIISIIRGYLFRRLFNRLSHKEGLNNETTSR